jgi:macrolide-specific efflux system membrane fusion protein
MKRRSMRWLLLAVATRAVVAWAWQRPAGPAYDTVKVARGDVEARVNAAGTLQPLESIEVGAQVSGQITRLHVQVGEVVEKGQLLVEIDPSILEATVEASEASLASMQAQVDEERAEYDVLVHKAARQRQLIGQQLVSREQWQEAEAAVLASAARLEQLRAQQVQQQSSLRADRAELGYSKVYAPIAGTVIGIEAKEGQTLNATYQTPTLLSIADLSRMTVSTDVSEADVGQVAAGMPVWFTTLGGGERRWQGSVRQVQPAPPKQAEGTAAKVVQYRVLFDVDNPDGVLRPQMTAQVAFVTAQAKNVLVAPLAALQQGQNGWQARVLDVQGIAVERAVRIATRDRVLAEVVDGLVEGESLVTGERVETAGPRRFTW